MANPFLTAFLNKKNSFPGVPFVPPPNIVNANEILPPAPKKRRRTEIEYIGNRHLRKETFRRRKASLLSKANELATLTGCQVMVVVASDSGHVHSYSTKRFAPLISTPEARDLIELCLSSPGDEDDQWQPPKHLTFEKTINGNGKDNQTEAAESGESGNEEPTGEAVVSHKDTNSTVEQPSVNLLQGNLKRSGTYETARRHENALPAFPPQFLLNNRLFPPFLFPGLPTMQMPPGIPDRDNTENEQKDG